MKYTATVTWAKSKSEDFVDGKYSRVHQWKFDGGMQFNASASPHVVAVPMSDPSFIDPEEAFIASISSCHMLFFLFYCFKQKFVVTNYEDHAEGTMGIGEDGKEQMLMVVLHPVITFEEGHGPSKEILSHLHEMAHDSCYIANSVKTIIQVSPQAATVTNEV